jgi:predicted amidohydrolase YtcJ
VSFVDAHLHLLSLGRLLAGDLAVEGASVADLVHAVTTARSKPRRASGWVVVRGFDDALADDRRLPRGSELDAACPNAPLRVKHRTGHASLLNALAWHLLPELPAEARIEPDDRGEPVLLVDCERWLNVQVGYPARHEVVAGLRHAWTMLQAQGVARVWDATPMSAANESAFRGLLDEAELDLEVRTMLDPSELEGGSIRDRTIKLFAADPSLVSRVACAHRSGATVAVHATTVDELDSALSALESDDGRGADRLEHVTLATEAQAERIAAVGAAVVTHPSWLQSRGVKYREQLTPSELRHLLPFRTLLDAGCGLAFGSDAPVDLPSPASWIKNATERDDGQAITRREAVAAARGGELWR